MDGIQMNISASIMTIIPTTATTATALSFFIFY